MLRCNMRSPVVLYTSGAPSEGHASFPAKMWSYLLFYLHRRKDKDTVNSRYFVRAVSKRLSSSVLVGGVGVAVAVHHNRTLHHIPPVLQLSLQLMFGVYST